jgi:glutaredoxin
MRPEPDIVLFTIPLCPKCAVVKRHVSEISEEYRELTVKELNMLTNIGVAVRHGFLTVPAMLVRGKPVKGAVSKQTIIDMLSEE